MATTTITTINRLVIFLFLLFSALVITASRGEDDQQQPPLQPYCVSDGANGVECTATSSDNFNLSLALASFRDNCTAAAAGDDPQSCQHFEHLFLSTSNSTEVGVALFDLSTEADFAGLSFASVSVYPAVYLFDFTCSGGEANQLSKQLFVGFQTDFSDYTVANVISNCPQLLQIELPLAAGIHELDTCRYQRPSSSSSNDHLQNVQLQYLVFRPSNYEVLSIRNYSFSCLFSRQLVALKLSRIPLRRLAVNAFSIREQEPENGLQNHSALTINLDGCQLTEAVLKDVRLDRFRGRQVQLMLDNNLFQTLPASLEGFLNSSLNSVSLFGNTFNCKRQKSYRWLLSNREFYQNRIWGARCSSGEALLNLKLYSPSCSWNTGNLTCLNVISPNFDLHSEVNYLLDEEVNLQELQTLQIKNCSSVEALNSNALGQSNSFPLLQAVHLEDLFSLIKIASDAFSGGTLKTLSIRGVHQVPVVQILDLVKGQPLLEELKMSISSSLQSVPRNAFSALNSKLLKVEFLPSSDQGQSRVLSIGSQCVLALSSSLHYLSFGGLAIAELQTGAFDLSQTSTLTAPLELNLTACNLDETKLLTKPFSGALRPLKIALKGNSIRMLLEDSFSFLLLEGVSHQVDLEGNPLICDDGSPNFTELHFHHYWLHVHRKRLKQQITGARCNGSGVDLFALLEAQFGNGAFSGLPASYFQLISAIFLALVVV